MSNQPPKTTAQVPAQPAGNDPSIPKPRRHDEDELHVPQGVSRGVGLFLIGLMIFLLVIWLVPGGVNGVFSGGESRNPVVVRFQMPGEGEVAWKAADIQARERALNDGLDVLKMLGDRNLLGWLEMNLMQVDPKDLQRIMVLDHIALSAGVEITNADLVAHLREVLSQQGAKDDDFKNVVRARGLDQGSIENAIRTVLRVVRFKQLVGYAGAMPDPKKIEEQWHQENVEFAFDYVALPVESTKEEARKSLPDDAGLQTWFDALAEGEKQEFKSAERRKAEVALFRDSETTPATELMKAFPEKPAEGAQPTEPEQLAHQYYESIFFRRFEKPKDDQGKPTGFFTFDEVKDACLAEGPVYFAMLRWLEDLNSRRTNGETIDLAAEAQKYGLEHQAFNEPLTSEQFTALPEVGDPFLASAVFTTSADGSFYASPVSLAKGMVVVRVTERTEPVLPPFAEIRDKVAEKWLEPKALELAQQRLKTLREGLESFEPPLKEGEEPPAVKSKEAHYRASAEAFRAAVEGAGLSVATRDYLNRSGPATLDPQSKDPDHAALFSLGNSLGLYNLEPDEVAAPGLSGNREKAYLVRLVGKRDVPLEKMSPTQYQRYKAGARQAATIDIVHKLDLDYLKKNYGLWLSVEEQAAKAEAAKAAPKKG